MSQVHTTYLMLLYPMFFYIGSYVVLLGEHQRLLHMARLGRIDSISRVETESTALLPSIRFPADACPVWIDGVTAVVDEISWSTLVGSNEWKDDAGQLPKTISQAAWL